MIKKYEDDVLRLCELVETWIEKQVATEEEIPLDDIKDILRTLWKSPSIRRSELYRLEILLKDIPKKRYRVTIVERMDNVLSHPNVSARDVSDALKNLVREELISFKQYDSLNKEDNLNLDKTISEIKNTKISCEMIFLPRETSDLVTKLKELSVDLSKMVQIRYDERF